MQLHEGYPSLPHPRGVCSAAGTVYLHSNQTPRAAQPQPGIPGTYSISLASVCVTTERLRPAKTCHGRACDFPIQPGATPAGRDPPIASPEVEVLLRLKGLGGNLAVYTIVKRAS